MLFIHNLPISAEQIRPYLEIRTRFERRNNRDFAGGIDDERDDALWRFRVGVDWKVGKTLSGELQLQTASDRFELAGMHGRDEKEGVSLANIRFRDGRSDVVVGRQRIGVLNERLLGSADWGTTGRTYDGIRLRSGPWDLFTFEIGHFLIDQPKLRISGGTHTSNLGTAQLYYKYDRKPGGPSTRHWTFAHYYSKKVGLWSLETENALQAGTAAGKDLDAWALHVLAARPIGKSTKLTIEANAASGGGNADSSRTFDGLLGSNHKFYGSMDLQSWRNMEELAVQVDHRFEHNVSGKISWRKLSLRDPRDAWYGASGGVNSGPNGPYVDPTGSSGRDIGQEIDLELSHSPRKDMSMSAGFGLFIPGRFVRRENGGSASRQQWAYFMAQWRF